MTARVKGAVKLDLRKWKVERRSSFTASLTRAVNLPNASWSWKKPDSLGCTKTHTVYANLDRSIYKISRTRTNAMPLAAFCSVEAQRSLGYHFTGLSDCVGDPTEAVLDAEG